MEPGLSPLVGSTRKSQTVGLISVGEMISTSAYSPISSGWSGLMTQPVLARQRLALGGDHVFALRDAAVAVHVDRAHDPHRVAFIDFHNRKAGLRRVRTRRAVDRLGGGGVHGDGVAQHLAVIVRSGQREIDGGIVHVQMNARMRAFKLHVGGRFPAMGFSTPRPCLWRRSRLISVEGSSTSSASAVIGVENEDAVLVGQVQARGHRGCARSLFVARVGFFLVDFLGFRACPGKLPGPGRGPAPICGSRPSPPGSPAALPSRSAPRRDTSRGRRQFCTRAQADRCRP